jgi:hypothetical protein
VIEAAYQLSRPFAGQMTAAGALAYLYWADDDL